MDPWGVWISDIFNENIQQQKNVLSFFFFEIRREAPIFFVKFLIFFEIRLEALIIFLKEK